MNRTHNRAGWVWSGIALVSLGILTSVMTAAAAPNLARGALFVMTNEPNGNSILIFRTLGNGRLMPAGSVATGGLGNGTTVDALQSQGGLVASGDLLFAVNAGSDEISVFSIGRKTLVLVDKIFSGGVRPTSLTVLDDLLYVVNAGSGEITGFRIGAGGQLTPLPGSTRALTGGTAANPSQVGFTPDGTALVVTEKGPNLIDVFLLDDGGLPEAPIPTPSHGPGPFGFEFDRGGRLIVSEALSGAASSYELADDGTLDVISGSVGSGQVATCWVVRSGPFAYMTNTGSGSVSRYRIGRNGSLVLQQAVAGSTGGAPIDMALDERGRFLYVQVNVTGEISAFRIEKNGSLKPTPTAGASGLPPFAQGIAVY